MSIGKESSDDKQSRVRGRSWDSFGRVAREDSKTLSKMRRGKDAGDCPGYVQADGTTNTKALWWAHIEHTEGTAKRPVSKRKHSREVAEVEGTSHGRSLSPWKEV